MEKSMELKELTDRTLAFTRGQKWSRIKWQDEKSTYKGFHIIVKDKDGQQFELQIHSKESKDVKKLNHVQHQVSRKPNSSAYAKDTLDSQMAARTAAMKKPKGMDDPTLKSWKK